jgi:CheY-like chemotaxis protein
MNTPLRIVVADDERPARALLAEMIEAAPDAELVGEAATGPKAVSIIERVRPDLALLDLEMPEMDGLEVARVVRCDRMRSRNLRIMSTGLILERKKTDEEIRGDISWLRRRTRRVEGDR